MKIAIVTLTSYGLALAKKIKKTYPKSEIYTTKHHIDNSCKLIEPSLGSLTKNLFEEEQIILFIMATGIVVRTIAPYLKHKSQDPAILVMDEKGQYVISLLSGHIGNANRYANEIAVEMDATPIITTSSDLNQVMAVDMFAKEQKCQVMDFVKAKEITAYLIEKEPISILSNLKEFQEVVHKEMEPKGAIIISRKPPLNFEYNIPSSIPIAWIVPQKIVVGIGCRRNKEKETLRQFLVECLDEIGSPIQSVAKIMSVSLKADEPGLIALAKDLKIPFECLFVDELQKEENRFEGSEFVKKTLGVASVSEPAGYIGSNKGRCLLPVRKRDGITISLWEMKDDNSGKNK